MGIYVKWDITYKCNLNCNHCVNGQYLSRTDVELTTTEIKEIIDKLSLLEVDYVHLLGGEPTFIQNFYEIMEYFFYKQIPVGFNTNGLKLATARMKQLLHSKYLRRIVVSIEGPTAEINDKVRGIDVFHKTISNLRDIIVFKKNHGLDVLLTINTVLSQENLIYVKDMIDLALDLGVDELNFLSFIYDGNATNGKNVSLTFEDEMQIIKDIASVYGEVKERLTITPRFTFPLGVDYCKNVLKLDFPVIYHGCGAGTTFAFMDNKGKLYPCDRYRTIIANEQRPICQSLINEDFYTIWDQEIFGDPFKCTMGDLIYKNYNPCNRCKYLRVTCFPCPVYGRDGSEIKMDTCLRWMELLSEKEGDEIE